MTEITVSIKTTESTFKKKYIIYEQVTLSPQDQTLRDCIDDAKKSLNIESLDIEDIKVRCLLVVQ